MIVTVCTTFSNLESTEPESPLQHEEALSEPVAATDMRGRGPQRSRVNRRTP